MTKKKTTYLSPETELLVVRFEENILSNDPQGYSTNKGGVPTLGNDEDYGSF